MKSKPGVSLLAWTTTPWTLPSNVALCVHPDFDYVHVEGGNLKISEINLPELLLILPCFCSEISTTRQYILMEARLEALFKKPEDYRVISKFPGSKLKGEEYEPLFDYYIEVRSKVSGLVLSLE